MNTGRMLGVVMAGCLTALPAWAVNYSATFTGRVMSFETNHGMFGLGDASGVGSVGTMSFTYELDPQDAVREGPLERISGAGYGGAYGSQGRPPSPVVSAWFELNGQAAEWPETNLFFSGEYALTNHFGRGAGRDSARYSVSEARDRQYINPITFSAEAEGSDLRDWIADPKHNNFSGTMNFASRTLADPLLRYFHETSVTLDVTSLFIGRLDGPSAAATFSSAAIAPVPIAGAGPLLMGALALLGFLAGRVRRA